MTRITYVGHATVLVAMDGVRLLTDPLLRRVVTHLRRRRPVDRAVLRDIDAMLVSHAHYDHLDLPSLQQVGRSTQVVVPRGAGVLLRRRRFRNITEVDEGECVTVGGVTIEATHADHDSSRGLVGPRSHAVGYVLIGSHRIYFAGDTGLFDEMAGLAGGLDVALVPIWGWGPGLGRGKHMDPDGAAEALALLRPRIAVPIHWGTYHPLHLGLRSVPSYLRTPAQRFVDAAAELAPEVEVRVLAPGESLDL